MEQPKFLTVKQAAEVIGCTTGRVRQLLDAGVLHGEQPNGEGTFWLVDKKAVAKYARTPAETGRPRKSAKKD